MATRHHRGTAVEVLDLIVDAAGEGRRTVQPDTALRECERAHDRWAARLVSEIPVRDGDLDPDCVDRLVIGVHREIDRLSKASFHGPRVRALLWPMVQHVRDAGHPPPYRVVDHGCGTGYLVRWLAEHGAPLDVELVGIDTDPVLVDEATRQADRQGLACRFAVGDALEPDPDATVILSTALLHHLEPDQLVDYFAAQERGSAAGFLHIDLRAGPLTVLGITLSHAVLMRLSASRHDGIRSAQRAHPLDVLLDAVHAASEFSVVCGGLRPFDPLGPMLTVLQGTRAPAHTAQGRGRTP